MKEQEEKSEKINYEKKKINTSPDKELKSFMIKTLTELRET